MITNATVLPALPCTLQAEYDDAAGLMAEFDDSIGYTSVMTVQAMTLIPLAEAKPAEVIDDRPLFVVAAHHGQYLAYLRDNDLDHRSTIRVTRYTQLAGLMRARIVLLPNWDRLTDHVEIGGALMTLRRMIPGISVTYPNPGGG